MKTAVSISDDIFEDADELAEEMEISRSGLYSTAGAEYLLARHRAEDVTARPNEVYSREPSGLTPEVRRAQARSIGKSDW